MTPGIRPRLTDAQATQFVLETGLWMSCDECFDYLDEFVDLDDPTGADVDDWVPAMIAHLASCGACHEEVESLRALLSSDS